MHSHLHSRRVQVLIHEQSCQHVPWARNAGVLDHIQSIDFCREQRSHLGDQRSSTGRLAGYERGVSILPDTDVHCGFAHRSISPPFAMNIIPVMKRALLRSAEFTCKTFLVFLLGRAMLSLGDYLRHSPHASTDWNDHRVSLDHARHSHLPTVHELLVISGIGFILVFVAILVHDRVLASWKGHGY